MPQLNILQHKSYHPYLEKNKQRVREDEARAAAEELAREQARIDAASADRLNELRRRAGSPSFRDPADAAADDNLPSTSDQRDLSRAEGLLEKHRKDKARQEKRERKAKERLDFEWPSETARREARRAERRKEEGRADDDRNKDRAGERDGHRSEDGAGTSAGFEERWMENGHINLFADIEKEENKPGPSPAEIAKKKKEQEADQFTVYLRPKDRDTKPWYADRGLRRYEDMEEGEQADMRRARDKRKDVRSKSRHDPLTQISSLLPKPSHSSSSSRASKPASTLSTSGRSAAEARLSRETSERTRALALIAKTKAERERAKTGAALSRWDDTPMSAGGGDGSWADDFERQKDKAGMRFWDPHPGGRSGEGRVSGRSWDR